MFCRLYVALGCVVVVLLDLPPTEGLSVRREHLHDPDQSLFDVSQSLENIEDGAEDRANVRQLVRGSFVERKQERNRKQLDLNELSRKRRAPQFSPAAVRSSTKQGMVCRTRTGQMGHCKLAQNCLGPEMQNNFWSFLQDLCMVDGNTFGVCCPDMLLVGIGPEFSAQLPRRADSYADDNGTGINSVKPDERGCGISTKQLSKISGDKPADAHEWPWMVALVMAKESFCGGSLITDRHVLTAGHCVMKLKLNQFVVRLGEYDFKQINETRYRDFRVAEMLLHPDFDQVNRQHDIAMLKLIQPSFFNSYIWPVCLPPLDNSWAGFEAIVTGWGSRGFAAPKSPVLQEVKIPIWANQDCQQLYINGIFNTTMCAGEYAGGKDACQYDSGGPLMIQLPNRRWAVVGVVSWGIHCGEANHPGIYTRVNAYEEWIMQNTIF